jgi:hypothetical protein
VFRANATIVQNTDVCSSLPTVINEKKILKKYFNFFFKERSFGPHQISKKFKTDFRDRFRKKNQPRGVKMEKKDS